MKFLKHVFSAAAVAACVVGGAAHAAVLTNIDSNSPYSPFGGFDWAPNGAAWTNGVVAAEQAFLGGDDANNVFTINYAAIAANIVNPAKQTLPSANLDSTTDGAATGAGTYEYTIFASVQVKFTNFIVLPGVCLPPPCVFASFETIGGTYDIYYDLSPDALAQVGAWSGFTGTNAEKLISGTLNAGTTNTFSDLSATNGFGISGTVTSQSALVSPLLIGTSFTSELTFSQLASLPPNQGGANFATPTSVDGMVVEQDPNIDDIFSVDGSQLFFEGVPEPMSLLLVGGALLAAGSASRRRNKAKAA